MSANRLALRDEIFNICRGGKKVVREVVTKDSLARRASENQREEYTFPYLLHKSTDRFYKERRPKFPEFLNRLEDQWRRPDNNITMRISYKGEPEPIVQWFKDQQLIESNARTMITAGDGVTELVIFDAQKSDAGFYCCRIENDSGVQDTNCHIYIGDSADHPPGRRPLSADYRLYQSVLYTPSQRYSRF
uniref:Ig-like domain-containing protein n=1 Tax=Ditylenchus dipsaci TaxID=166011 RepID=A0A915CY96_9BILA